MHIFKCHGYCQVPLQPRVAYSAILFSFTEWPGVIVTQIIPSLELETGGTGILPCILST